MEENKLFIYTICYNPTDYPGKYTMRPHLIKAGKVVEQDVVHIADSLEEIRKTVPPGSVKLSPYPGDEPCIIESWI